MKRLILLSAILLTTFYGCSLFKQREVSKSKTAFSQSSESEVKADSSKKYSDQSVIIEKETADTLIKGKAINVSGKQSFDIQKLIAGLVTVDSGLVTVKLTLDTATNQLTTNVDVKPQDNHVKIDKSKETRKDIKQESAVVTSNVNKEAVKTSEDVKNTVSKPKGLAWVWIICLTGFLILAGLIIYLVKRYLPALKKKDQV